MIKIASQISEKNIVSSEHDVITEQPWEKDVESTPFTIS